MNKAVLAGLAFLIVGLIIGMGVGSQAFPRMVTETVTNTVTQTVTHEMTRTVTETEVIGRVFEIRHSEYGRAFYVSLEENTITVEITGSPITLELRENTVVIRTKQPIASGESYIFEVKLYDKQGTLLATGEKIVTPTDFEIAIPITWLKQGTVYKIELIAKPL